MEVIIQVLFHLACRLVFKGPQAAVISYLKYKEFQSSHCKQDALYQSFQKSPEVIEVPAKPGWKIISSPIFAFNFPIFWTPTCIDPVLNHGFIWGVSKNIRGEGILLNRLNCIQLRPRWQESPWDLRGLRSRGGLRSCLCLIVFITHFWQIQKGKYGEMRIW